MSDKPAQSPQGASNSKAPRVSHSSNAGGSGKTAILLAGAAALALLLGGGYYAWKNSGQSQVASNDNASSFSSPSAYNETTGPEATANTPATANSAAAAPAIASPATAAAPTTPQKKTRVAAAEVPEETIGVSRVSARANNNDEVVVTARRRPVWRYAPRAERLAEYYPAAALERGREGEASLHCIVGKKGALDCERVSETPARAGFGTAALQVARTLRHAERRADGKAAAGTPVNLHVVFRMAEGERRG